jgi:hypothetical protein
MPYPYVPFTEKSKADEQGVEAGVAAGMNGTFRFIPRSWSPEVELMNSDLDPRRGFTDRLPKPRIWVFSSPDFPRRIQIGRMGSTQGRSQEFIDSCMHISLISNHTLYMNKKRTGWPEISRVEVIIVLAFLSSVHPIMTDELLGQAEYVIFDMDGLLSASAAHDVGQR